MAPDWDNVGEGGLGGLSTVGMLQVTFGMLTMLSSLWFLGTWIVPKFLLQNAKLRCYGKLNKGIMWVVLMFWLVSLIISFLLFVTVNTNMLGSFPVHQGGD